MRVGLYPHKQLYFIRKYIISKHYIRNEISPPPPIYLFPCAVRSLVLLSSGEGSKLWSILTITAIVQCSLLTIIRAKRLKDFEGAISTLHRDFLQLSTDREKILRPKEHMMDAVRLLIGPADDKSAMCFEKV